MKAPAFQFYVRDWLCSRSVLSMSGEQVKAYLYLLCESWLQEPRTSLPNDDIELASMARVSVKKWKEIKGKILKCFCLDNDGRYYNEKLSDISNISEVRALNRKNKTRTKTKQNRNKTGTANAVVDAVAEADKEAGVDSSKKGIVKGKKKKLSNVEKKEFLKTVVDYLNKKIGTVYKYSTAITKEKIYARIDDGFTIKDFQIVIDKKAKEWKGTKFEKYLSPKTLFSNKFETYLNQVSDKPDDDYKKKPVSQRMTRDSDTDKRLKEKTERKINDAESERRSTGSNRQGQEGRGGDNELPNAESASRPIDPKTNFF